MKILILAAAIGTVYAEHAKQLHESLVAGGFKGDFVTVGNRKITEQSLVLSTDEIVKNFWHNLGACHLKPLLATKMLSRSLRYRSDYDFTIVMDADLRLRSPWVTFEARLRNNVINAPICPQWPMLADHYITDWDRRQLTDRPGFVPPRYSSSLVAADRYLMEAWTYWEYESLNRRGDDEHAFNAMIRKRFIDRMNPLSTVRRLNEGGVIEIEHVNAASIVLADPDFDNLKIHKACCGG